MKLTEKLFKELREIDSTVSGFLRLYESPVLTLKGRLEAENLTTADLEEAVKKAYSGEKGKKVFPILSVAIEKSTPKSLVLVDTDREESFGYEGQTFEEKEGAYRDEVEVLYQGNLPIDLIEGTPDSFKKTNFEFFDRLRAVHDALAFTAPLVLDKEFRVIDGNLRLEIARLNKVSEVPVIILDTDSVKSAFLRLLLNRSSEFQRWVYPEVDKVVDSVPQLQPLLEPFGFFSNKILPVTFFADTILKYQIDEFNAQQATYSQDESLAAWAEMRREQAHAREAARMAARKKPRGDKSKMKSIFDLSPTEEDFLPQHDANQAIEDSVEKIREDAERITNIFDEKTRKKREEQGLAWQPTRRTTKQVALDARKDHEEKKAKKVSKKSSKSSEETPATQPEEEAR